MTTTEWLELLWIGLVGACVGSFLNVVVHRLPAGKNLLWPASHCPRCGHSIRAIHNIPVLGWLMLRGKCYDCREKISPRYPIVEAATAGIFVLVAWLVFIVRREPTQNAFFDGPRWVLYASLLVSLLSLGCMGLIKYDGAKIPRGLHAFFVIGTVAAVTSMWWMPP